MKATDGELARRANLNAANAEAEISGLTEAQSILVRAAIARAFVIGYAAKLEDVAGVRLTRTVLA